MCHVEMEREVWGSPLLLIFTSFLVQPRPPAFPAQDINQLFGVTESQHPRTKDSPCPHESWCLVPLGKQGSSAVSQNTPLLLGMIP